MIERIVFDEEAETLRIRFRRSGEYLYSGVPRAIYEALSRAKSAGTFFNEAIKGRFACQPLRRRYPVEE
ncbi:KTSC domain-containing protein [Sphingomonas aracearum]|uniref:KTSC domain-containing protein n=1 Tax=Sphingomonas aracearum TaxID=2283317 RepID=A0A369VYL8_9SPHN|nr:KTSC domain-containing protein [Sphingomonas aracearum]